MKYIAYYMLFSISTFFIMAFFELPDKVFGILGILFMVLIGFSLLYLFKKLKTKFFGKKQT